MTQGIRSTAHDRESSWRSAAGAEKRPSGKPLAIAVLLGTIGLAASVSVLLQGFSVGIGNNIHHIPIVLRLYDLPQFANDAFIQSLRHFVSFIYFAMAMVATPDNVASLFLLAHLATRALTIAAATQIALTLGLRDWKQIGLFIAVMAFGIPFYGVSAVGLDGLWINYFTHTELAQAVALLTLCLTVRDRFWLAAMLWGVAFDLNAFVGAWCVVPLALLAISFVRRAGAAAMRSLLIAAGSAVAIVVPDLVWIWATVKGQSIDFSYLQFLRDFEPHHFMIDVASWDALVRLGVIALTGILGLWLLAWPRGWAVAYAGFGAVFLAGCAAPFLTGSALILNLHLLRVDGIIQSLAAAFAIAAFLREALREGADVEARIAASLGLVSILIGPWSLILLALSILLLCRGERFAVAVAVVIALSIAADFLSGGQPVATLWGPGRLIALVGFGLALYAGSIARSLPICALGLMLLSGIDAWFGAAAALLFAASILLRAPTLKRLASVLVACAAVLLGLSVKGGLLLGANRLTLAAVLLIGLGAILLARIVAWRIAVPIGASFVLLLLRIWGGDFQGIPRVAEDPPSDDQLEALHPVAPEWREVQLWARAHTDPAATFLVPPELSGFEQGALRRVWVADREGAAVMWQPQFFHQWWTRENEVWRLRDLDAALAYACRNAIAYIVLDKRVTAAHVSASARPPFNRPAVVVGDATASPVFRNRLFDVFAVSPCVLPRAKL